MADFLSSDNALIKSSSISAAVRSSEQAKALSGLGINVLQLDLSEEQAVIVTLLKHESMEPTLPDQAHAVTNLTISSRHRYSLLKLN